MKKAFIAFFVLCSALQWAFGQENYGRKQLGVYYTTGNSIGQNPSNSAINNLPVDLRQGSVGFGLYTYFQLRDDSTYGTAGFFRFLRVDLGIASRAGLFELNSGNIAKITTASLDLGIMFPFSFKAADEIYAYTSAGPVMSYQYGKNITPNQGLPDLDSFKAGLAFELGFRMKSGSVIGYRTSVQFGDFSFRTGCLFFGFSPQNAARRKPGRGSS